MKKTLIVLTILAASSLTLLAQGRVNFNNFIESFSPITLSGYYFPSGGGPGAFVGADYSIQLLWLPGTFHDWSSFWAANPNASASVPFFGTTGYAPTHGPTVDGAGLFDGGIIQMGGPPGIYTMEVRAWYNGGQYPTYYVAAAAGQIAGQSALFTVEVTSSPTPPPSTPVPVFSPGLIPEPSALALAALGIVGAVLFRRRKQRANTTQETITP